MKKTPEWLTKLAEEKFPIVYEFTDDDDLNGSDRNVRVRNAYETIKQNNHEHI